MNGKVIAAIAVVAVLAIAGTATAIFLMQPKDSASYDAGAFNIVSRVNSEGSGFYIDDEIADGPGYEIKNVKTDTRFFGDDYALSEANKAAWGGLILGDPGLQSIQHTQLATIASKVGLQFKQYTTQTTPSNDTLYYVTGLANYGAIIGNKDINGGIIWEPQYQRVIQEYGVKYTELALTNDVFPEHACCVIAMNHNWLKDNSAVALKFLAGYKDAVDFINEAKINTTGADYKWLVDFAVSSSGGTLDEAEVRVALTNITYLYDDDANGSLSELTSGISELATDLKDLGSITTDKFKDADKFAKAFVDDSYLKDVIQGKASKEGKDSITVAAINGDIHQLAIQVAKEKGFFDKYGLTVTINTGSSSGGDIADLLINGDVKIGFLGAPPATLKTINGNHILV